MWQFLPASPLPPPGHGPPGPADGLAATVAVAMLIIALAPLVIAAAHQRHRTPARAVHPPAGRRARRPARPTRLAVHAGATQAT